MHPTRPSLRVGSALALALAASSASAQVSTPVPAVSSVPASFATLEALDLAAGEVQELSLPPRAGAPFTTRIQLGGETLELALHPHSLRSADFRLLVQGADGEIAEATPEPPATYRGEVQGHPGSLVAASLVDGRLTGILRLGPDEPIHGIQPLGESTGASSLVPHLVYDARDTVLADFSCGTEDGEAGEGGAAPGGGSTGLQIAEIAIDADFPFFQQNGSSVANTQNDVENVMNAVEAIYDADAQVLYDITTILVRTSSSDPYTTSNPSTLLSQFAFEWNVNQSGIQRDVAHLFTGTNLDGSVIGIAQLSVICFIPNAYGLSQSRFTSNFTSRVGLTAHELGHNWSAPHCNGEPDCSIMCSGLGGCTGILTSFGSSAKADIVAEKNANFCFTPGVPPPLPVITGLKPVAGVQVLSGAQISLFGTDFESTSAIAVDGVALPSSSWQVVNDTKLTFKAPQGTAIGTVPVTVTNFSGVSNLANLTYLPTDPPLLSAPTTVPFANPVMAWTYGAGAFDAVGILIGADPTTIQFNGLTLLLNGFGVHSQFLDAAGLGSYSLLLPTLPIGTILVSQMVTFDGVDFDASQVKYTVIGF